MNILNLACLLILAFGKVAVANPVPEPDIYNCRPILDPNTTINCCAPISPIIVDFQPPPYTVLRIRPAAHLLDAAYLQKYSNAVAIMRNLNPNHPWSFIQQANIHCAYCDGHYNQTGYNVSFLVHSNWLFYPFHRAYLYFYERILGKLIGDDSFALPFWNWDNPEGMMMPAAYTDPASPLYDVTRYPEHLPPNVVALGSYGRNNGTSRDRLIDLNLRTMHQQMLLGGTTAELFIGGRYGAGDKPPAAAGGSLENSAHSAIHFWTGVDMSHFTTSGQDPIFFAHHANIDRLWEMWKDLLGGNGRNFNDSDWLDSSFLFWDENMQLVRIRVRDLLDSTSLGYTYQTAYIPWIDPKYRPLVTEMPASKTYITRDFPIILDSPVSVQVTRENETRKDGDIEEVLVVDEIEMDMSVLAVFDVYVSSQVASQLAGSYSHLATGMSLSKGRMKTRLVLGLTDLLENIGASGDKSIVVTFVPQTENANVTVGSVRIDFSA